MHTVHDDVSIIIEHSDFLIMMFLCKLTCTHTCTKDSQTTKLIIIALIKT